MKEAGKKRRFKMLPAFAALCFLCGCGGGDTVYLESAGTETEEVQDTGELTTDTADGTGMAYCVVYVCGAVAQPGVYELPEGSRIYEAVALAGGMTEDAAPDAVNQAETVTDGQMLKIPTVEEAAAGGTGGAAESADDGLLDINQADASDFMTLPGIGQSKADAIVQYRTEHGAFSAIEELMNVDGIKEGVFNKIKDSIKV